MGDGLKINSEEFWPGISEHLAERAIDLEEAAIRCIQRHPNRSAVKSAVKTFLALTQCLLSAFAFGNVLYDQHQVINRPVVAPHSTGRNTGVHDLSIAPDKAFIQLIALGFTAERLFQQPNILRHVI